MIKLRLFLFALLIGSASLAKAQTDKPFGDRFPKLDSQAVGKWWEKKDAKLKVARDQVVAFAVYTHDRGVLKMSAQLYPLMPGESREVRLEFRNGEEWKLVAKQDVNELGWSAHFRIKDWDNTKNVVYRIRHGEKAEFEGLIRKDPIDKDVIVVGNLSCNSSRTTGPRPKIVENLKKIDPDLLFFAGDQTYRHTEHTWGWIEFGIQFRDILKDRPVVSIPDDHDVGQANIWGENGKKASTGAGPDGGFFYPPKYVNMVQRHQTWHLPDPYDASPIKRNIGVYYTSIRVGGIDFAILEDRKFKSGPKGKIPKMGPRPDHINDPKYDRDSIDLPNLKLLGDRQLKFLNAWSQDWTGAKMKAVLSQTAFCGAVHLHGTPKNRLLADLDCNGWPQTGRNKALREIRRARAVHLCGDQHLSVVVKHGIDSAADGPYAFTSPAIVNTIYGRWWHPEDEKAGPNAVPNSPLPWTGDYVDGLGNHIQMMAYANPEDRKDEMKRADGFGVVRFNKKKQTVTFECWPRFADVSDGDKAQFPGWPITVESKKNDGRKPVGMLANVAVLDHEGKPVEDFVVQVFENDTKEVLYTFRASSGTNFELPAYRDVAHTLKVGTNRADSIVSASLKPRSKKEAPVYVYRLKK